MGRSERLIKPRHSWFSPKSIEVEPWTLTYGGRALDELGPIPGYRIQSNSECRRVKSRRQNARDKLRIREGNNPDQQLRCLNTAQWKGCEIA